MRNGGRIIWDDEVPSGHRPRLFAAVSTVLRGMAVHAVGLYLLVDPVGLVPVIFLVLGAALSVEGLFGFLGLDLDDSERWRFVFGMIRYLLVLMGGMIVATGSTVIGLAPEGAILLALAALLGTAGLLEVVPAIMFGRNRRNLPMIVGGLALMLLGAMPVISSVLDASTIAKLVGAAGTASGAWLIWTGISGSFLLNAPVKAASPLLDRRCCR